MLDLSSNPSTCTNSFAISYGIKLSVTRQALTTEMEATSALFPAAGMQAQSDANGPGIRAPATPAWQPLPSLQHSSPGQLCHKATTRPGSSGTRTRTSHTPQFSYQACACCSPLALQYAPPQPSQPVLLTLTPLSSPCTTTQSVRRTSTCAAAACAACCWQAGWHMAKRQLAEN